MPPANLNFVTLNILPSQNFPELLTSTSLDFDLEYLYKSIMETPLDAQSTEEIPPNSLLFRDPAPSNLPPQTPSVDNAQILVCSALTSLPPSLPPNWHRIPQKVYDYGRRQWNFILLEAIAFRVNGRPGVNMGDAFRRKVAGLDGQDELVLQGASRVISCRLSVCLS